MPLLDVQTDHTSTEPHAGPQRQRPCSAGLTAERRRTAAAGGHAGATVGASGAAASARAHTANRRQKVSPRRGWLNLHAMQLLNTVIPNSASQAGLKRTQVVGNYEEAKEKEGSAHR